MDKEQKVKIYEGFSDEMPEQKISSNTNDKVPLL